MVYTLGEMLLDVITEKEIPRERYIQHGHAGGAMLNTAVSLSRSGIKTTLISETGDDEIATFLLNFLNNNRVQTNCIKQYRNTLTSVALARLDTRKKPTYTFLKNYPRLRSLVSPERFQAGDILLFGSLYALDPAIRPAIGKIQTKARNTGSLILYDPNIRQAEQLSDEKRKTALYENLQTADIIKGSDEDFDAVFGRQTPEKHVATLQNLNPGAVIFLTLGAKGALVSWKKQMLIKPAKTVPVVSTIGAGDGFNAGVIAGIVHRGLSKAQLPLHLESLLDSGISFSTAVCGSKDNYIPNKMFYIR